MKAFDRALALAAASTQKHRHGAIVLLRKGAIGVGINVGYSQLHVSSRGCAWSRHAEVAAIMAAKRVRSDLSGCTLVSARALSSGCAGISKPCSACWAAILGAGIGRVVYHDGSKIVSEKV